MGKDMTVARLKSRLTMTLKGLDQSEKLHGDDSQLTGNNHQPAMLKQDTRVTSDGGVQNYPQCNETTYEPRNLSIELMVHPGFVCKASEPGGCGTGPDEFSMSTDRQHEMNVLSHEALCGFFVKAGFELRSVLA